MIQCPSCAKDIADDSAHCGFCGAKIETGSGKKTMMGFAALTGDALQEAAEEAKQARQAAEQARSERPPTALPSRPTKPVEDPKPKLPQLPTPAGGSPAIATGPEKLDVGASADPTASDAKTAVMGAVGSAPSTIEEGAVEFSDTDPMSYNPADLDIEAVPSLSSPDTQPELNPITPAGPSEFGGGPSDESGPSEFGSGKIDFAQNTLPDKKKTNPALIVVGVIVVLGMLCCVLSLAYSFLLPLLL